MAKVILSDTPSALYRHQIRNIAAHMWRLTTETALHPLRNMMAFNKAQKEFDIAENEAYLCCSVMDSASIENEDRADNATTAIMEEMIQLRNEASGLIENEPNTTLEERRSS
jgi:hypothetical protein